MAEDVWGPDEPAAVATEPLPPRLAALAELIGRVPWNGGDFARAEELPEVRALMAQGWRPLDDAPYTVALPAVWPPEHRCWVADRLPRVVLGEGWAAPWSDEERDTVQRDLDGVVATCGLPPRPRGRIWLLRSPWPGIPLDDAIGAMGERARERGLPAMAEGLTEAAREVLAWPEVLVRSYVPG